MGWWLCNGWFSRSWRCFCFKRPNGIRPTYFYEDDEVVVVASERPVIQTVFNVNIDDVKELERGHALIIKKRGNTS